MVLLPIPTARHISLTDTTPPTDVKPHQTLTKWLHLNHQWKLTRTLLWLMQRTDPFCKYISKWLLNGKAPSHEVDTFTHIKGLLYKHFVDSDKKLLALVVLKYWCFMVLVEAYHKLDHQGLNRTYHLIKWQYNWKVMNKDFCKYITNCAPHKREKARTLIYPLQMMYIPDRPSHKTAIDLVSDLNVSTSANYHILTITDH